MARPLRLEQAGALWHVTSRGNEQRAIFLDDDDRLKFIEFLSQSIFRFGWLLHAWVLMTNHFHLMFETPQPNLSRGMHWVNGRYAQWFNRKYKRVGHLFQGRFQGIRVEKEGHLIELSRYIVLNPVRAHMVARPEEWRWSSFRATAGLESAPEWLTTSWLLDQFSFDRPEAHSLYRQFVADGVGLDTSPWDGLKGQIFLGSEAFLAEMRALIGEKPRSEEHPRAQREVGRPKMKRIVAEVVREFRTSREVIRRGRGGVERMAVAHLGFTEGLLGLREIRSSLSLRSSGSVTMLVQQCQREMKRDPRLRAMIGTCSKHLRAGP